MTGGRNQNTRGGVQMTGESPVVSELVRDHTNPGNNPRNDSTWAVTALALLIHQNCHHQNCHRLVICKVVN